ncbi:MAG: hypothetical protein ACR2QA_19295 [Solirubrobacteraceae bacterium]
MSGLAEHVEQYLQLRRAVGFKLVGEGQLLADFVRFADQAGESTVRTETALAWVRLPAGGSRNYLSRRLRAVRSFARYLHALDPACEVPSIELLRSSKYRPAPYLYSQAEIIALMAAARDPTRRCEPRRCRRSSGCWPAPGCGSAKRSGNVTRSV